MRRLGFGIGIGLHRVSVLVRDRGSVVWAKEVCTDAAGGRQEVLTQLLLEMPRQRMVRPTVNIALGPGLAQLKPLSNLPETADRRIIAGILKESPQVFFLGPGAIVSGMPWRSAGGVWWGTAMELTAVTQVLEACARSGVRVCGFGPAAAVLSHSIRNATFVWQDGDVSVGIRVDEDGLMEAVRQWTCSDVGTFDFVPELARHGNCVGIADAWGAAWMSPETFPLMMPGGHQDFNSSRSSRYGAVALLTAIIASVILPITAASLPAKRLEEKLAEWRPRAEYAAALDQQVRGISELLSEASAFDAGRISVTTLLDDIAATLAHQGELESMSIVAGESLTITITSDRMPSVLGRLGSIPGVTSVGTSGVVERLDSEQGAVQRVTVQANLDTHKRRTDAAAGEQ